MSPKELRSRRMELAVTIQRLAAELGVTPLELQEMESGKLPLPAHEVLSRALDGIESHIRSERWRDCLVVEDDDAVRELFARRLRAEGLSVDEAADGFAALDAAAVRDYRLMLLDLRLPNLSGMEVLERLMKKASPPANVIVISGAGDDEMRDIASHQSVQAVMRKAFAITNADVIFPALAALAKG